MDLMLVPRVGEFVHGQMKPIENEVISPNSQDQLRKESQGGWSFALHLWGRLHKMKGKDGQDIPGNEGEIGRRVKPRSQLSGGGTWSRKAVSGVQVYSVESTVCRGCRRVGLSDRWTG